jgi:hypothetical protein
MADQKLNIVWTKPILSQEVKNYNDIVATEFKQHNMPISNRDIPKIDPKITKFYKFIVSPFSKGEMLSIPLNSDTEFDIQKLQNFKPFEYDNMVAGSYGKVYGEYLVKLTQDLKKVGYLEISAPIVIRFVNFGETRRSGEESYFLFNRHREMNLALHYGIPIKVWVIDLIPSVKTVRSNALKYGYLRGGESSFLKFVKNVTGKDTMEALTARERFKVIQRMAQIRKEERKAEKLRLAGK